MNNLMYLLNKYIATSVIIAICFHTAGHHRCNDNVKYNYYVDKTVT